MKSSILLAASVAVLSMTACSSEPAPGQPAQQQQEPAPQKEETGTSIRVGNDGVAIEGNGSSVNVSGDSAAIEIKTK